MQTNKCCPMFKPISLITSFVTINDFELIDWISEDMKEMYIFCKTYNTISGNRV